MDSRSLNPAIEASHLYKRLADRQVIDDLSLLIQPGEIYALVGPDGAGKTTAIRLLCGALAPDLGRIRLAGIDLGSHIEQARALLGYLPQRFSLYAELTVEENLQFLADIRGLERRRWKRRSEEILAFVDLLDFRQRRADQLSGGMKQKLGLAAALIHEPAILLLDEPTGGVDPVTRQAFWQLISRLLRQDVAVLISTPYMDEAARCNRVGFLRSGRLEVEGPPEKLTAHLKGRMYEASGAQRRALKPVVQGLPGVESARAFGDRWHLRMVAGHSAGEADLNAALHRAGLPFARVRPIEPTLEDAFLERLESTG
jgi:ABC-2 type transport system ATP-binding protein